jgi:hypothetical protein
MDLPSEVPPLSRGPPASTALSRSRPTATSPLVIVGPFAVLVPGGRDPGDCKLAFGRATDGDAGRRGLAGVAAGALATLLLYRAARERLAANVEIRSMTARVGDIVETAMDPIITIDGEQRIVLFNSPPSRRSAGGASRSSAAARQAPARALSRRPPRPRQPIRAHRARPFAGWAAPPY